MCESRDFEAHGPLDLLLCMMCDRVCVWHAVLVNPYCYMYETVDDRLWRSSSVPCGSRDQLTPRAPWARLATLRDSVTAEVKRQKAERLPFHTPRCYCFVVLVASIAPTSSPCFLLGL